jgi:hypothetical protein
MIIMKLLEVAPATIDPLVLILIKIELIIVIKKEIVQDSSLRPIKL